MPAGRLPRVLALAATVLVSAVPAAAAQSPTPTPAAPAAPATTAAPAATPTPATTASPRHDRHAVVPAIILGALAAAIALASLAYALLRRLGIAEDRVAPVGHAWREARWRAGGTWGDFRDWLRTGR